MIKRERETREYKRNSRKRQNDFANFVYICVFRVLFLSLSILSITPSDIDASGQGAKQKQTTKTFTIDVSQSKIGLTLIQEGLMSKRYPTHSVSVTNFSGKVVIPKDETRLSVEVEAVSASLTNVDQAMSEFERKEFHNVLRNLVLESSKFPTIKFVSASVTGIQRSGDNRSFTLNGDLIMHGVTKRVSFPVSVMLGKDQLRATGDAKLKQSDFGMTPFERGLGLIKVGDEVKVNFTIVAKTS